MNDLLTDPDQQKLLVIASKCCLDSHHFDWYDSNFLRRFEAAQRFLGIVRPDRLEEFTRAFDVLRTRPDFSVRHLDTVFDPETFEQIRETVHALPYVALEHYESGTFGRSLLRHEPFFTSLQVGLTERVSELVGEPVSPAYNFLSLYRGTGKCDPHLDEPISKWTLDVCIEQNVEWPIYFSQVVDWPTGALPEGVSTEALRSNPALGFESVVLTPNKGAVFSGSSQWHFRDPIPGGKFDFCHLLFFHYLPRGTEGLADASRWAEHFSIPELKILIAADDLIIRKRKSATSGQPANSVSDRAVPIG